MACEFFVEGRSCRCGAVRGFLIPSIFERDRFCRTEYDFVRCPTYRAYQIEGAKLSQDLYYALWMPEEDEAESYRDGRRAGKPGGEERSLE